MADLDAFDSEGLDLYARLISSDTFDVDDPDFQAWLASEGVWEADERRKEEAKKRANLGRTGVELAFKERPEMPLPAPIFKTFYL